MCDMNVRILEIASRFVLFVDGFAICSFNRMADIPIRWRKLAGK